jgi:hypothetical protein
MKTITKSVMLLAVAGTLAISAATPSFARNGRVAAAAGIGFATGALIGAAAANNNAGYYDEPGPGYAYYPAPDYAYEPAYAPAPVYGSSAYAQQGYAYGPARSADPYAVYYRGEYIGSDPDPRIRGSLLEEAKRKD